MCVSAKHDRGVPCSLILYASVVSHVQMARKNMNGQEKLSWFLSIFEKLGDVRIPRKTVNYARHENVNAGGASRGRAAAAKDKFSVLLWGVRTRRSVVRSDMLLVRLVGRTNIL